MSSMTRCIKLDVKIDLLGEIDVQIYSEYSSLPVEYLEELADKVRLHTKEFINILTSDDETHLTTSVKAPDVLRKCSRIGCNNPRWVRLKSGMTPKYLCEHCYISLYPAGQSNIYVAYPALPYI
jgi:hypothetical protein